MSPRVFFETITARLRVAVSIRNLVRLATPAVIGLAVFLAAPMRHDYFADQPSADAPAPARAVLERAVDLNRSLFESSGVERTENDFLDLIGVYERAIRLDENRELGDLALMAEAETYRRMGVRFKKPRYFYSALQCYSSVLTDYPATPHVTHVLVGMARIHEQDLGELDHAARSYSEIISRFPASVAAREAQASLARIALTAGERTPRAVIEARSEEDTEGIAVVSQIRHFSGPDYSRVILDLSMGTPYEKRFTGTSLVLVLPKAKLTPLTTARLASSPPEGMLRIVRTRTVGDGVEVAIECTQIRDFAIFTLAGPPRLVVDLRGSRSIAEDAALSETAALGPLGARQTADGSITLMRALGLKVRRIVIDPGHGGSDTGAMGKDGIYEKDVVLDIALRLRAAIQQNLKDVDVVLTRDSDRFVPLEERTAVANAKQADLFISIHTNSSPSALASGVETYFLSLDAGKEELEVATRENASTSRNAGELQALLERIVLDNKVAESRDFAQHVQNGLVSGLGKINPRSALNRGVKKAPFVVLLGTNMPSILAEVSFISHPKEADALRTVEFRQSIAESLFDGIQSYVHTLSTGVPPAGGQ